VIPAGPGPLLRVSEKKGRGKSAYHKGAKKGEKFGGEVDGGGGESLAMKIQPTAPSRKGGYMGRELVERKIRHVELSSIQRKRR